jgi:hypothetical protein
MRSRIPSRATAVAVLATMLNMDSGPMLLVKVEAVRVVESCTAAADPRTAVASQDGTQGIRPASAVVKPEKR